MTTRRATLWVGLFAALAYANSLPNGFAYDDTTILARNPVVTSGDIVRAWVRPYWPQHAEASGLYRPVTVSSFAAEWRAFGVHPVGYHAMNVAAHVAVSLLLLALLLPWTGTAAAAFGASLFAVHPVHTEAVANIVGRGELYAAALVLSALLLYDRRREWSGIKRVGRLIGIGLLYFLALGSKEIAVTLPGLMLITEALRKRQVRGSATLREDPQGRSDIPSFWQGAWKELPVYGMCAAVLGAYLTLRLDVVGAVLGELPAPAFRGLSGTERIATALSLWPEYMRLLLFPASLSADYSPAVLFPVRSLISLEALAGVFVIVGLGVLALRTRHSAPLVAAGVAWFAVSISPISHLFFPTGVLLAERTLYLPSVGLALVASGTWSALAHRQLSVPTRRALLATTLAGFTLLTARTVARNPSWMSTYTVLETLAREHPESSLALRTRGMGLSRAGDPAEAAKMYELAVELAPSNYSILTEVGNFYGEQSDWSNGERLLQQAARAVPHQPSAYRLWAGQLILQGRYRDAHRVALRGLAATGADRELYGLVSETYVAKGDFQAAIRARNAAVAQDPGSIQDLERLSEVYRMAGDTAEAEGALRLAKIARTMGRAEVEFTPEGRIAQQPRDLRRGAGR